jgi:hypothetical protein
MIANPKCTGTGAQTPAPNPRENNNKNLPCTYVGTYYLAFSLFVNSCRFCSSVFSGPLSASIWASPPPPQNGSFRFPEGPPHLQNSNFSFQECSLSLSNSFFFSFFSFFFFYISINFFFFSFPFIAFFLYSRLPPWFFKYNFFIKIQTSNGLFEKFEF